MVKMLGSLLLGGFVVAATAWPAAASDSPRLWITDSRLGTALLAVDVQTGDRELVELGSYPTIIDLGVGVMDGDGALLLEAVNAAQQNTVVRYDPDTGSLEGISGFVDPISTVPRGEGPDFEPGLTAMAVDQWGDLIVLRKRAGPMRVVVDSGDRTVLSQSVAPPVGEGVDLIDPIDLVVEDGGTILVADRFGSLVRVSPGDGSRRVAYQFVDLVEGPHRLARLADGRIAHAFGDGGGREVVVLDRGTRIMAVISGPSRGSGPELLGIADLVADPDGDIYVLDLGRRAVIAVDPANGERRVIADDPPGLDLGFLSPQARFVDRQGPQRPAAPRRSVGRVGSP